MSGGKGSGRNQPTPRAERAERRAVFRQRQQRLQQLTEQKEAAVKAEQRRAQAAAAAQLRRSQALQEARVQTVSAGPSALQTEAQQQGSQAASAALAEAKLSSKHCPTDSSTSATAAASASAFSDLAPNPQRPSDEQPASLQVPGPLAAQSAAVDESFEEARWRCNSRTPASSALAAGLSASQSASHQLHCDHSGSGGSHAANSTIRSFWLCAAASRS